MARFEDILYLLFWNGYTEDCRQAVYASKETITDERIWFPFLIQATYGPNKKTLLQIMTEHSTPVENATKRKLVLKKEGVMIYKDESQLLTRIRQFEQMAADTNHTKLFENVLGTPDTDGTTILMAASNNNCHRVVSNLMRRGADYNQQDASGATPQYYAYNSKFGRQAWDRMLELSKFKSEYKSPKLSNMYQSVLEAHRRRMIRYYRIR